MNLAIGSINFDFDNIIGIAIGWDLGEDLITNLACSIRSIFSNFSLDVWCPDTLWPAKFNKSLIA